VTEQPPPDAEPRRSPLHEAHVALGAQFTDFGGWLMPLRYGSELAEHHAVRSAAGLFDISHMAEFEATGPEAGAFLDAAVTAQASAIPVGRARYAMLLAPDGGILDDLIVYRLEPEAFLVVANAANREIVAAALAERLGDRRAMLRDATDATALIAVQGPRAEAILAALPGLAAADGTPIGEALHALAYYAATPAAFDGARLLVARTGYTGEDGFELFVEPAAAPALWDALLAAGAPLGLVPAGLAARDTLRLEAGMPLYGHELSRGALPAQAGLGRVVPAGKDADFVGRDAVLAGPPADAPVLVGLAAEGRRAARAGYQVLEVGGSEPSGVVTSGALSPTLGHPIAMALLDPALAALGTEVEIDVRGTRLPARVVALPFYRRPVATD